MDKAAVRKWNRADASETAVLIRKAVSSACGIAYSRKQCDAWTAGISADRISLILEKEKAFAAEMHGKLAGIGSVTSDGYLDLLYVLPEYQHRGIASMLCDVLEKDHDVIRVHASVCAEDFFQRRGYETVRKETVFRNGTALVRYEMCCRRKKSVQSASEKKTR